MHTHTYAHENTCACMILSTRWSTDSKAHNLCTNLHTHSHTHMYERIDVQIRTHVHIYTYIHVHTLTHIHIYTHTHTKCIYEPTQSHVERQCGSERHGARSRCRPRKLCSSISFDAIKPYFAPSMQGLHCTHVLQHQYPSIGAAEYASTQESKPENDQSDCSREMIGQWRTTNPASSPSRTQITTARRPDHTRSSALVRSQFIKFMANPCRELRLRSIDSCIWCSHISTIFPPFLLTDILALTQCRCLEERKNGGHQSGLVPFLPGHAAANRQKARASPHYKVTTNPERTCGSRKSTKTQKRATHIHVHAYIHIYVYTCIHTHLHIHICIYTCIYIAHMHIL